MAVDNNVTHLFATWPGQDEDGEEVIWIQRAGVYLLSLDQYVQDFRGNISNILDWGQNERLDKIKAIVEFIDRVEEDAAPENTAMVRGLRLTVVRTAVLTTVWTAARIIQ